MDNEKLFPEKVDSIDSEKLKAFCRIKPTLEDTASFFGVNPKTIERFIRDKFDKTFVEFRNENMVFTRHAIIRKAISMALNGNTAMLIFCLKNLCGWSDRLDFSIENGKSFILAYNPHDPTGQRSITSTGNVIDAEAIDAPRDS